MADSFIIYLLRHGELEQKGVLAGQTDFQLSNIGFQQLKDATEKLDVDQVISSPLYRCLQFATPFTEQKQLPLSIVDDLAEMNFGDWDGKPYEQLWQDQKPNIGDFWQNPKQITPPNGESFEQFYHRVVTAWSELTHQVDCNTLVVTHAGVIKLILANLLNPKLPELVINQVSIDYGRFIAVRVYKGGDGKVWPSLLF